jgi:hypothetical protein
MKRMGIVAVIGLVMLSGCAATPAEVDPEPSTTDESAYGGFAIDPPADDEVVLTITGDSARDFTYRELQDRASVDITILEPFVGVEQSFTGIPLNDLFADAGVDPGATVETVALNDYRYSDTAQSWAETGAILAIFRDGELIPMDAGGPIRIVFDTGSPSFTNLDAWNWSLRSIDTIEQ